MFTTYINSYWIFHTFSIHTFICSTIIYTTRIINIKTTTAQLISQSSSIWICEWECCVYVRHNLVAEENGSNIWEKVSWGYICEQVWSWVSQKKCVYKSCLWWWWWWTLLTLYLYADMICFIFFPLNLCTIIMLVWCLILNPLKD